MRISKKQRVCLAVCLTIALIGSVFFVLPIVNARVIDGCWSYRFIDLRYYKVTLEIHREFFLTVHNNSSLCILTLDFYLNSVLVEARNITLGLAPNHDYACGVGADRVVGIGIKT